MATPVDPLAGLRAIREPALPPESLVETLLLALAGGVVTAMLVVGAGLALRAGRRRLADRVGPRRRARTALAAAATLPPCERLAVEARLLRGYVAAMSGPEPAAARGEAWLAELDRTFSTTLFSRGPGRVYGDRLYGPVDAAEMADGDGFLRRLFGLPDKEVRR